MHLPILFKIEKKKTLSYCTSYTSQKLICITAELAFQYILFHTCKVMHVSNLILAVMPHLIG